MSKIIIIIDANNSNKYTYEDAVVKSDIDHV